MPLAIHSCSPENASFQRLLDCYHSNSLWALARRGRGDPSESPNHLIVGENGVLPHTRAKILKDCWETATAKEADAQVALHARGYDLLVFSQAVSNAAVKEIMAAAVKLHTDVKFLVISEEERQRPFGCAMWPGYWTGMTTRPSLRDKAFHSGNGAGIHPESIKPGPR
jgi:hypothetical protein